MEICRVAAIYNIFDGEELLKYSINSIKDDIDLFIIVYQTTSNWGEHYDPYMEILYAIQGLSHKTQLVLFKPTTKNGFSNETEKRNLGIEIAKQNNCTHFLNIDVDECYKNFAEAKDLYFKSGKEGSCCKIFTYFKLPTLRFETEDTYFVPFIHKLLPNTKAGNSSYPYYVDPTRRINCSDVVLLDVHMHHYSWVRSNIERKARNSSAKRNIERGSMLIDYHNPNVGAGFYVKDAEKKLVEVKNYFNINI